MTYPKGKIIFDNDFETHNMKHLLNVLICLFWLNSSILAYADNNLIHIPIHQISTDNGLSHTTVNTIYRDELGFVWIGTTDGLNRYDGHSITTYRYDITDDKSIKAISVVTGTVTYI